jgi:hypothetical protein
MCGLDTLNIELIMVQLFLGKDEPMTRLTTVVAALAVLLLGCVSIAQAQDFVGYRTVVQDGDGSVQDGEVELLKMWGRAWGYVRAREGNSAWLVGLSHNWTKDVLFGIGVGREEGHDGLRWAGYLNATEGDYTARVFYEDGDSGDRHDAALVRHVNNVGVGLMSLTEAGWGPVLELNSGDCTLYGAWTKRDNNWNNGVVGFRVAF